MLSAIGDTLGAAGRFALPYLPMGIGTSIGGLMSGGGGGGVEPEQDMDMSGIDPNRLAYESMLADVSSGIKGGVTQEHIQKLRAIQALAKLLQG